MKSLTIVSAGASSTSTGAAVLMAIPLDSSGGRPRFVRVSATASAYIKAGDSSVVAAAGDAMIQPGDSTLIDAGGCYCISIKSLAGTATVNIQASEYGRWDYPGAFSVSDLFLAGERGAWYDPSDFTSLSQDSAGTLPVTAVGQPVGLMRDKSGRGSHATQLTAISRPVLQQDGSGKFYLAFNGTSSWMSTAAIDFTGTDKMTAWTGVRVATSGVGVVAEFSANTNANAGSFYLVANEAANRDSCRFSGSTGPFPATAPVLAAPRTRVLTAIGEIITDTSILRSDGVQVASTSSDQGTGNFSNYPLYLGARAGSSLFFNGQLYSLIVRGALSSNAQITSAETYVAGKTGVTL